MAKKENKGGRLRNEQVEEDNKVKGKPGKSQGYVGTQDTGDQKLRQYGNAVQKKDGLPDEAINE
jgi:hypothetical protein